MFLLWFRDVVEIITDSAFNGLLSKPTDKMARVENFEWLNEWVNVKDILYN